VRIAGVRGGHEPVSAARRLGRRRRARRAVQKRHMPRGHLGVYHDAGWSIGFGVPD